jgi:hypothetical protein
MRAEIEEMETKLNNGEEYESVIKATAEITRK